MAPKITQTQIINDMRVLMGLNADGTRNGNGLLSDVKALKDDIDSVNRNLISINHKLERLSEERKEISNNIKEIKQKLAASLENINKSLADKISVNSISKAHKTILAVAASIGALGGIFSIVLNVANKLG